LTGEEEDPNNVIGKVEIQDILGTLGVDYWSTKADRNWSNYNKFPSISVTVTKSKFSLNTA
jgi:hypothetical protein